MKQNTSKKRTLSIKILEKLHPLEREKALRDLLSNKKNKRFLGIINEELKKTELEQAELERTLEASSKKEEKIREELSTLVRNAPELEETKKPEKNLGVEYRTGEKPYEVYSTYAHKESVGQNIRIEVTSTSSEKSTGLAGEESLSTDQTIKKMTELYKGKQRKENGH